MFNREKYKNIAEKILAPIKSADNTSKAKRNIFLIAQRSNAGRNLPEYYLIYFLLSDLLNYHNTGRFEKIAWSFPIDYKGKVFLIEHRKMGIGIFVQDPEIDEKDAEIIAKKIDGAVKSIRPFYDFIAEEAVKNSEFNIINNNHLLFERFSYFLSLYKKEMKKYAKYKGVVKKKVYKTKYGEATSYHPQDYKYYQNAKWFAISCIEAFFSWTEHLFIHLAVISENVTNGKDVSNLIDAEWKIKFRTAIKSKNQETTNFYNELLIVRQQLRNFVAHGAFGKNGNAFKFHSKTGAVPVLMNYKKQKNRFSLHGDLTFKEEDVINLLEDFIKFLWKGSLEPAMYYTQHYGLPTILTFASDGIYSNFSKTTEAMHEFAMELMSELDNAANMDW